jgi:sugar/nucleoside kinase (ribokinase family)
LADARPAILCGGIAVQDILMRVEQFPAPGTKVSASDFIVTGGGCAANAAVAIARLGGRAAFAGPLGDRNDAVSDRILSDLAAEHVECTHVVRVAGATASVSLILLDAEGEKTIATRRGQNLAAAFPAQADAAVAGIDGLLVDNRFPEFVVALCQAARKRDIPVVIDGDKATMIDDPLLALGTHVIFSNEGLSGTTGIVDNPATALMSLREQFDGFLSVTDGPNGVLWIEDDAIRHMPAFPIRAVDTLGAGDTFHGAFTLALVEGQTIDQAMRFASAAAALKCLRFGGNSGTPTRAAVDEFLKTHG